MRWRNALVLGVGATLMTGGVAHATSNELSVSSQLQDRREVTSGTRAYAVGFEDGRFYANGWHITGEMGGVWTPPMKLLDGLWFGVDDQWVGQATTFTSGHGYVRYDLPSVDGLGLSRTDFAPDGRRAVLFGLTISNPGGQAKTVPVKVDAHSELMGSWPWGTDPNRGTPDASNNLPDAGSYADGSLVFTDDGSLGAGAPVHHYAALVASNLRPDSGEAAASGGSYHGPQPGTRCAASDGTSMPSACDDGPFGNGTGGELKYSVRVPAHASTTVWVAAAGSDQGLSAARSELAGALRDPGAAFAAKQASRAAVDSYSQVTLPGDPLLQQAVDWSKQNLADETQTVQNLQIRWTDQGKNQFAPVLGTVKSATFYSAGFPDYPWLFGTDGEYTAFAGLAVGQFETVENHLRALRDVSDVLNDRSGVVVHEAVQDGSIYFGHDSQRTAADGTRTNDFNTDETVKFPSIVATVWRWTGDDRFRDEMYDFAKRNLLYVRDHLDADHDGWPEGSGNVELTGMGAEKLDNAVYYIRALNDLADMARSKHDLGTLAWTTRTARDLESRFESTWWNAASGQYADSLGDGNAQIFQKHWIGVVPMEAEMSDGSALPSSAHGQTALAGRETPGYSGTRPLNQGLFHTGQGGGADGKGVLQIFSLGNAIAAVGEGNYGRMGAGQQQRYTDADAETMISEPETGGTPDEQPGAMPEILPSPDFSPPNLDRCWTCRSMVMQAWGNYGTAWPVVHQQLGVAPRLDEGAVDVIPQVPDGQPWVKGDDIRVGSGSVSVFAAHAGNQYTTRASLSHVRAALTVGAILPASARVAAVYVDGRKARHYDAQATNRGLQVTAAGNALTVLTR
jgi:hypothetical protein